MLYDNAQLLAILLPVHSLTRDPLFAERIAETCDWVMREMIAEGGGFAATLDADSEGVEGKFYVWRESEIDAVLGDGDDAALFKKIYDVTPDGNWEGQCILNRIDHPGALGEADESRLAVLRAKLLAARAARVRPGWDDKVLADWNGLMIAALARTAAAFGRDDWRDAAVAAFDFVREKMTAAGQRPAGAFLARRAPRRAGDARRLRRHDQRRARASTKSSAMTASWKARCAGLPSPTLITATVPRRLFRHRRRCR